MTRVPASEHYDAEVGVFPAWGKPVELAFGVVKYTYTMTEAGLVPAPPEPLFHDLRDPDLQPRLLPGSDYWPNKEVTDVVVLGSARASRPVTTAKVSVHVGRVTKQLAVFGRRVVEWKQGQPAFSAPEPFEEMPIVNALAYGGFDPRVPTPDPGTPEGALALAYDHPGVYPRNPFGKGYVVLPDPAEGIELPNLENPLDLLTPQRLIVQDPTQWWRQPLPWSLEWLHPMMFPRYVYLGVDAWFPGPVDATLPEVRLGFLPPDYRERFPLLDVGSDPDTPNRFSQDASLGLSLPPLTEGTPIEVRGMHPDGRRLKFALPRPPTLELNLEGSCERSPGALSLLLVRPDEGTVCLTYVARMHDLPRMFVAGLHGEIPLSLQIDREARIVYDTPPTVRSQLLNA